MAGRGLLLVIVCLLAACAPEFPRVMRIDDSFDAYEEAAILKMFEEANKMGQELIGRDLFVYGGRYRDRDGFTLDDLGDDVSVIYELNQPDENYRYLEETGEEDATPLGYGPQNDVLVFAFNMPQVDPEGFICLSPVLAAEIEKWRAENPPEEGETRDPIQVCADPSFPMYLPALQSVVLHELGHVIGLGHIDDKEALMYPYSNGLTKFTPTDKGAFCCLYDCRTDRYECPFQ